jgi:LPXTG-site transpeptidase (sortase) family protein
MSKTTLVLSLLVIGLLIGILSLVPMPMPLPAPHMPAPSQAAAAQASATAPPAASITPLPLSTLAGDATQPPRATRYVEPTEPPLRPISTPTPQPRLVVPDLNLDQPIVPVTIQQGIWDLAELGEQVGWLTTTGRAPEGDLAVALVGHVNISLGHPGPFANLKTLELYDQVIYRLGAVDYIYGVESIEKVEPEAVEQLYVPDGKRLLLVTCSDWSYFWSHYARRLIVTARLLETRAAP